MKLHAIPSIPGATRQRKRLGRGNASGHGTYSGRGCKGQGQRKSGNVRPGFEGGQTPIIMRLPKLRGFRNPTRIAYQVVNVADLEARFEEGQEVTPETLLHKKLIGKKDVPVKLLGDGKISKKMTIKLHKISAPARAKIVQAGGKVL